MRAFSLIAPLLVAVLFTLASALYDFSKSKVVELTPVNFKSLVSHSNDTWLVEFYAPWCGHCKSLAPAWDKAAEKLAPIGVKLGAVDADQHRDLGQKFGVQGFPTLKVFNGPQKGKKARKPTDYSGGRTAKEIINFAHAAMPNHATRVTAAGLPAFFNDEPTLPHALVLTAKSTTAPVLKAVSARVAGAVALGEMRKKELTKDVRARFALPADGEDGLPKILRFPAGSDDAAAAEVYEGKIDLDRLVAFLKGGADAVGTFDESAGPAASDAANGDAAKKPKVDKIIEQPEAHSTEVGVFARSKHFVDDCAERQQDNHLCMLAVVKDGAEHAVFDEYKALSQKYKFDPLVFNVVSLDDFKPTMSALGLDAKETVLIFRPNKKKVAEMSTDDGVTAAAISQFVDRALGGDLTYKRFTKDVAELPAWGAADAEGSCSEETDQCTAPPE